MRKILLFKEIDLEIDLEKIVYYLNLKVNNFSFQLGENEIKIPSEILVYPESYETIIPQVSQNLNDIFYTIFLTQKPYDNNYFSVPYEKGGSTFVILTFFDWNKYTKLTLNNGLIYFICFGIAHYLIDNDKEFTCQNKGCIYDFLIDKTNVDYGMKYSGICENCLNRLSKQKMSNFQNSYLIDLRIILNDLSNASKWNQDIIENWVNQIQPKEIAMREAQNKRKFNEKRKIKIFVSYSSKDRELKELLIEGIQGHLHQRNDFEFSYWSDSQIDLGANWKNEINQALKESDVALLMVSASFVSSKFIESVELANFFNHEKNEKYLILPVLARSYDFSEFELISQLNFFKTYYNEYGFNKPIERNKLLPFDKLGNNEDTTDEQLNLYYKRLADFIYTSVKNKEKK